MSTSLEVQLGQRGVVTLPKELRERYALRPGDNLTFIDLGGVIVLTPRRLEVDALADRLTQAFVEQGETLESMLQALREERERYDARP
jgi:AbrB family looped-hinge helix DNA binding protein